MRIWWGLEFLQVKLYWYILLWKLTSGLMFPDLLVFYQHFCSLDLMVLKLGSGFEVIQDIISIFSTNFQLKTEISERARSSNRL